MKAHLISSALTSVARLGASLAAIKIGAIYLGPVGFALLGQFQSATAVLHLVAGVMCSQAIAAGTAQCDAAARRPWLAVGVKTTLLLSIVSCGVALLAVQPAAERLGLGGHTAAVVLVLALMPLSALFWNMSAALGALDRPLSYALVQCMAAVASVALLIVLLPRFGLSGAMAAPFIANAFALVVLAIALRAAVPPAAATVDRHDAAASTRQLVRAGLVLLAAGAAPPAAQLVVRTALIDVGAIDAAGQWQAAWKVSEAYLLPITILLQVYFLPRFAQAHNHSPAAPRLLLIGAAGLLAVMLSGALALWVVGDAIVRLLLDARFTPAAQLLPLQALADGARAVVALVGIWFISGSRWGAYLALELAYWTLFAAAALLAIRMDPSAQGVVIAYVGSAGTALLGCGVLWSIRRGAGAR
jgi:PST family polysaccharide transporter